MTSPSAVRVAALRVAPVKGLATVPRTSIRLAAHGVEEDRRLFLLDEGGAVATLRTHPRLVQAVPRLDLERGLLDVHLPDGTVATSALDDVHERCRSTLFGRERRGRVLGGAVPDALSRLARAPVRVVLADRAGAGWDEGPVSLLGRASTAALGAPGSVARYRMLVEVAGTAPYEEDTWVGRAVQVDGARIRVTQQLGRCVVITRSPGTGERDWDGLHALAEARGAGQLCLGVVADVLEPGDVRVGGEVRVLP